jgi:hypothetical protein
VIADLDETIRQLLILEMPIKNGQVDVSFDQPKREWSSRLSRPAVNLFLYDVRENNVLRQHAWEEVDHGGNGKDRSHVKRTPFRVDCCYMLTTWANDPEDEHRLLVRAMLALFRFPVLPEDRLAGDLRKPAFPIQARLACHDRLTNPAEMWSSLDNELRPSIPYIATLSLDPWSEVTGDLVQTAILRWGQAEGLPGAGRLAAGTQAETAFIGGTIRDGAGGGPVRDIQVAIRGTGLIAITDRDGHFVLGSIPPGSYTLVAWRPDGAPVQKEITVPAAAGAYDLELEGCGRADTGPVPER